MTALLEATGLILGGRLRPSDLAMEQAELVCLIGPNGSGKTSLLHALARIGGAGGNVRIDGVRPDSLPSARRRLLLSYLPASRDIAWPLTARDLVRLAADDREADEAMAALDLAAFAGRRVDRLSTGERSRVLIARALAPRPRLLLLDEPAANLDPLWQLRLMDGLRAAVGGGQGVIAALHDLDLAARFADRLVLMDGGAMVAEGGPKAVLGSAKLGEVFGIERRDGFWHPSSPPSMGRISRSAGPRSSP